MSKENKKIKNEYNDEPAATPFPTEEIIDNFTICPHCSSSIKLLKINEQNNIIEFKCLKENKDYIKSIKEYLEEIEKKKDINIDELKDRCKIHNNNNYVSYCYDCKCHLCNECLKERTHINHKKTHMIEIQLIDKEKEVIEKVINNYKNEIEKLINKKKNKTEGLEISLKRKKEEENKNLKDEENKNKKEEENELKLNWNKYIEDIEEIKKEYEKKIKERKNKYEEENNKIYNKYKLIKEKINIKYNLKIKKLEERYNNKINEFGFDKEIKNNENMLKINEMIYNLYKNYNNNYYNCININTILLNYTNNKYINDNIMKKY